MPIGLAGISHLLNNLYLISRITDEMPLGVLLVGPPGIGKSFILQKTKHPMVMIVNDITPRGLQDLIVECESRGKGYIVIPELERVLSRQASTNAFCSLANIALEEGLERIKMAGIDHKLNKPVNIGLVSALTTTTFKLRREFLEGRGFLSRHLVVGFHYCGQDLTRIERALVRSSKTGNIVINDMEETTVTIPGDLLERLLMLSKKLANYRRDTAAFRAIKQIRALLKAEALKSGRTEVEIIDLQNIYCLLPFIMSGTALTVEAIKLKSQATDPDYFRLREHFFEKRYFGPNKMYPMQLRKWAEDRLVKMQLLQWKDNGWKTRIGG